MADRRSQDSPTLPLPPPRSITVEDLVETATAAAVRAVRAQQPRGEELIYRPPIWCGIIIDPWGDGRLGPDPRAPRGGGDTNA